MKRQRGRNRRSGGGGNNPNRHFESNGPDVKIRGSAQQVLDKYLQYARDAQTSGDRVMSEAYFQHAEHYQRLLAAMQPKDKPRRDRDDQADNSGDDAEARDAKDGDAAEAEADEAVADGEKPEKAEPKPRRRASTRKPRDGDDADAKADDSASDPLKVIDGDEAGAEDAPKPRRRRTYKKRDAAEADAEASDDDGVMKTLSRGRAKASDTVEAPEPAGDESPAAPAAE
ncbi:MAG: DUF4167 domain-containing protein [Pseudomonadota bacterium]